MKVKFKYNFTDDLAIPLVFSIGILMILGIDAYQKFGLGPAVKTASIIGAIILGLCLLTILPFRKKASANPVSKKVTFDYEMEYDVYKKEKRNKFLFIFFTILIFLIVGFVISTFT
jgi:hypothetical protein